MKGAIEMSKGYGVTNKVIMIGIDGMDPLYTQGLLSQGKLPNIKKFIERGTTTKDLGMMGALPAYTPPCWCSLATGAWPGTHGITDFWNHKSGDSLSKLTIGFNSNLCQTEYIWDVFAKNGKKAIVFGWPTAWPPTNEDSIYVDGSGIHPFLTEQVDYEKFFEFNEGDFPYHIVPHDYDDSGADCFVTEEVQEKEFQLHKTSGIVTEDNSEDQNIGGENYDLITGPIKNANGWANAPEGAKEALLTINSGTLRRYILILADDGVHYNRIQIYTNKNQEKMLAEVVNGAWTESIIDTFNLLGSDYRVGYRMKLINLSEDGSSMKLYYGFAQNLENNDHTYPVEIKKELFEKVGIPNQLSNASHSDPEKLLIMTEVAEMAFRWTMDAIDYLLDTKEWDGAFHGLHIIDAANHFFLDGTLEELNPNYEFNRECLARFYALADEYVGRSFKWLDKGASVIVVSDHGGLVKYPGYETPKIGDAWGLNIGLMSELGYTKTKEVNGVTEIDWENTTAVAQRSSYIYVNLKGRDPNGIVDPEDLDDFVTEIISNLYAYRDPVHGERVISMALRRDEMVALGLHDGASHNLGDIFFILEPKFTRDQGNSFSNCKILGTSLKCVFMMAGTGIKENYIIPRNVQMVDMTPTLCHLAGVEMPNGVDGGVLYQALK